MKKNNDILNNSESIPDKDIIYVGTLTEDLKENAEIKKLREKFVTSEEDDALSENRIEDQEEQNEIHNNFFDNQPIENKREIKPAKY